MAGGRHLWRRRRFRSFLAGTQHRAEPAGLVERRNYRGPAQFYDCRQCPGPVLRHGKPRFVASGADLWRYGHHPSGCDFRILRSFSETGGASACAGFLDDWADVAWRSSAGRLRHQQMAALATRPRQKRGGHFRDCGERDLPGYGDIYTFPKHSADPRSQSNAAGLGAASRGNFSDCGLRIEEGERR